ncbi:MAG: NAD(P)H:quinone oxidoreductase [Chlamydiales bacterium]|nr:NAD(P)H:quinone oxidoreductase [Chlamydiales bacterium]
MTKVLVLFYSSYGHVHKLALAIAEGVKEVSGVDVTVKRVPETLSEEILAKQGALDTQKSFLNVPVCTVEELSNYDAIIFGSPTRFGNMCGQLKQFLDATGKHWVKGSLVGKVASCFTSTGSQHGGQETTLLSMHIPLLHQGMIIVGLPYSFAGQTILSEITGGSPYGATTISGNTGERLPSANELAGAKFQGKHVATITKKLFA